MFDRIGAPLFSALAVAAEERLGPEHPCTRALRTAAAGSASEMRAAEDALKALPDITAQDLMAAAHRALRADPAALLAALRPHGRPLH